MAKRTLTKKWVGIITLVIVAIAVFLFLSRVVKVNKREYAKHEIEAFVNSARNAILSDTSPPSPPRGTYYMVIDHSGEVRYHGLYKHRSEMINRGNIMKILDAAHAGGGYVSYPWKNGLDPKSKTVEKDVFVLDIPSKHQCVACGLVRS